MIKQAPPIIRSLLVFLLLLLASSCATPPQLYGTHLREQMDKKDRIKPVMSVLAFENRSNFQGKWNLADDMADMMITELLQTDRVILVERKHIDDVLGEIVRQGSNLFRKEGRAEKGRLKNVQYIVRGVITDFTVTGDTSGWFGVPSFRTWFGGSKARVALNVYVTDVETGEIISSIDAAHKASSGFFGGQADYKNARFGGDAFFQTPLGKATQKAMGKAIKHTLKNIPANRWAARVAEGGPDLVIINGGHNVGVTEGDVFIIRKKGRTVTDPLTGNVIDTMPGQVAGRIKVTEVRKASAYAQLLDGEARRGDILEKESEQ